MGALRDFGLGVRLYARGLGLWRTRPGLAALGLVPGLVTAWLFVVAFVVLLASIGTISDRLATAMVGEGAWHAVAQVASGVAVVGAALVLSVLTFVSVTSVIGQGVFETISHRVDDSLGEVSAGQARPWWASIARSAGDGAVLVALGIPVALAVALLGLIPVLGVVLAWGVGATAGGWLLALDLTSIPFERRGMTLHDRRRLLGRRRAVAVGFGAVAFVASSFAPLAVVTMPLSIAGGVHLARMVIDGEPA